LDTIHLLRSDIGIHPMPLPDMNPDGRSEYPEKPEGRGSRGPENLALPRKRERLPFNSAASQNRDFQRLLPGAAGVVDF